MAEPPTPGARLRESLAPLLILAALAATPMIALALNDPFIVKVATRVVIFAIAATALNFVVGYGGLVSLCHAGFFGVGGYVVGILAWHDFNAEPLWFIPGTSNLAITLPAAIVVSGLIAGIVGAISLRTSGPYFLMITLAFNQMFYYGAVALQKYGGDDGLQIMSTITLGGLDVSNRYRFFYLALAVLALTLLLIGRYPWFGVGFSGTPDIDIYIGVSSAYLLMAEEMGLAGLAVFLAVMAGFFAFLWRTWRRGLAAGRDAVLLGLGGALAGALAAATLDHYLFNLTYPHMSSLLWLYLGLAVAAALVEQPGAQPSHAPHPDHLGR